MGQCGCMGSKREETDRFGSADGVAEEGSAAWSTGPGKKRSSLGLSRGGDEMPAGGLAFSLELVGSVRLQAKFRAGGRHHEETAAAAVREYAEHTPPFREVVLLVTPHRLLLCEPCDFEKVIFRLPLSALVQVEAKQRTLVFVESSSSEEERAAGSQEGGLCASKSRAENAEQRLCHVLRCESTSKADAVVRVTAKAFHRAHDQCLQRPHPRPVSLFPLSEPAPVLPNHEPVLTPIALKKSDLCRAADEPVRVVEHADADVTGDDNTQAPSELGTADKDLIAELNRSFYRRSQRIQTSNVLDTCSVAVNNPEEFNWEEAGEYIMGTPIDLLKIT